MPTKARAAAMRGRIADGRKEKEIESVEGGQKLASDV